MRRVVFAAVAMLLVAFGAVAQEHKHAMTTSAVAGRSPLGPSQSQLVSSVKRMLRVK